VSTSLHQAQTQGIRFLLMSSLSRDISSTQMHLISNEQIRTFWWNKDVWKAKQCERIYFLLLLDERKVPEKATKRQSVWCASFSRFSHKMYIKRIRLIFNTRTLCNAIFFTWTLKNKQSECYRQKLNDIETTTFLPI